MKQITLEWLKAANDDLLTIDEIIGRDYLTHLAAFHAQQAVEKSFKAVLEELSGDVPKIHNLVRLLALVSKYMKIDVKMDIIEELDKLYIDSRYPGELGLLPHGQPTVEEAAEFYRTAERLHKKIGSRLRACKSKRHNTGA